MINLGPALRSAGDPLWSKVALLLQGGTTTDKSAGSVATSLTGASKITQSSSDWLDAGMPTIKIDVSAGDGITPGVLMPLPALGSQDWTIEMSVRLTAAGFYAWADDSGNRSTGLRLSFQTATNPLRLDVDINNGAKLATASANASTAYPFNVYLCAERVGRYVYLSHNGVVVATLDLGSASYSINAPAITPRFGQQPAVGSTFTAYVGRTRVTIGQARYGGSGFTPPAGLHPIG